jgi:hypothetical protein
MTCPGKNAQSSVIHLRLPRLATSTACYAACREISRSCCRGGSGRDGGRCPSAGANLQGPGHQKTLAGAALKSLMGKCEKDAATACSKSATDKKLSRAAKSSHVKQCVSDTVGS